MAFQDEVKEDNNELKADIKELSVGQALLKGEMIGFTNSFNSHMEDDKEASLYIQEIKELLLRNTITLESNVKDMETHILRTNLLEDRIEQVARPISMKEFSGKFFKIGVSIATITAGIIALINYLKK
jgi:hypothetical protein